MDHKSTESPHEHKRIGRFRRYVLAPASILLTIAYVLSFVGEVRETMHKRHEEHPAESEPSVWVGMRDSVDRQLQQIRGVDARSLAGSFSRDLDTHDCSWRFQCKERPVRWVLPSLPAQRPVDLKAFGVDTTLSRASAALAGQPAASQVSKVHPLPTPAGPHKDLSNAFDTVQPKQVFSDEDLHALLVEKPKGTVLQQIPTKEEALPAPSAFNLQNNAPALAQLNQQDSGAQKLLLEQDMPPAAVIRFGVIPIPTFHTIFGTARALRVTLSRIGSTGGWAVAMFLICTFFYAVILKSLSTGRDGNPLVALIMAVGAPVGIPLMVQCVQWVAGGLFYGVSWVLGEIVLLAAYAGGIGLIAALPHIYKAPREVIEAAEVIRNV